MNNTIETCVKLAILVEAKEWEQVEKLIKSIQIGTLIHAADICSTHRLRDFDSTKDGLSGFEKAVLKEIENLK